MNILIIAALFATLDAEERGDKTVADSLAAIGVPFEDYLEFAEPVLREIVREHGITSQSAAEAAGDALVQGLIAGEALHRLGTQEIPTL